MRFNDKVALVDSQTLSEMITELSYLQTLLQEGIEPLSRKLLTIDKNLERSLLSFDDALAKKSAEVLEKVDVEKIQKNIEKKVIEKISSDLSSINNLGALSELIIDLADLFVSKEKELEVLMKRYENNLAGGKTFSFIVGSGFVVGAFIAGTLFYPGILYLIRFL